MACIDTFFFCLFNKATGIHHYNVMVRFSILMHNINIIRQQLTAQHFAVHHILATAEGDDIDFVFI